MFKATDSNIHHTAATTASPAQQNFQPVTTQSHRPNQPAFSPNLIV